ncbi:hypothetical protein TNCV_148141 [Trichonephila clavipes]|nr:hypothetical protein TNCV_148141 [Trichonephila clavipes]
MSDQNRKRKQVTLSSFMKTILKDEQQNSQEVKEDSRSTAKGVCLSMKRYWMIILQEEMEVSENLSFNKILDKKKAEEVHKNRQILCSIIKTVIFCGKQGIAIRGHSDYDFLNLTEETNKNEGNFRVLVKFRVEAGDDVLEKHFKDSGRNTNITVGEHKMK